MLYEFCTTDVYIKDISIDYICCI